MPVPCVILGKDRSVTEAVASQLLPHDFSVNASLYEAIYSTENFRILVRALLPRPKALIIGGGFSEEEAKPAREVWEEYVKEFGVNDAVLVRYRPGPLGQGGPKAAADWIIGELEKAF
jgi:hypothetical protein